eukprot:snap_masked-scaffold28_size608977-processed-gene-4.1 protein:Tk05756 transcript:snap_masked-scaffold28_size608977-processed-gene-4.1-mRNA-1 annotation:"nadph:adrenodoxin mitochondrial"
MLCLGGHRVTARLAHRGVAWASGRAESGPRVCIVGSGPAGFYTAQHLLSHGPASLTVDLLERLPVPFGLVRYGVAPDHPDVKNVDHTFTRIAQHPRVGFMGHVNVGVDVRVAELRSLYDVVILAYGAAQDRALGVPGEDSDNVVSARSFVGFYNGLPEATGLSLDLDVERAVVLGVGNVALDVARILLTPIDVLRQTDITEEALARLAQSRIERVSVVGRRGPLQVAFTIKELREMVNLPGCRAVLDPADFQPVASLVASLVRPRKRLTQLMVQTALGPLTDKQKALWAQGTRRWDLKLLRTPQRVLADSRGRVAGVQLGVNRLVGPDYSEAQSVADTGDSEVLDCGLVLKSIGYKSVRVEAGIPFDEHRGIIPNVEGQVAGEPGLYCSGWLATGPKGVIVDTMNEAFRVGARILRDRDHGEHAKPLASSGDLKELLHSRGVQTVDFVDWEKVDETEKKWGATKGKPREKFTNVNELITGTKSD